MHISITSGAVISKKIYKQSHGTISAESFSTCCLCHNLLQEKSLSCLNILCDLACHINCLANIVLEPGQYVPVEGNCPQCHEHFLWGDVFRKYKGCYADQDIKINVDADLEQTDLE